MSKTIPDVDAARAATEDPATRERVAQAIRDEESRRWALMQAVGTLAQGNQLPSSVTSTDIANRAAVFLQSIRPDLQPATIAEPVRVTPLRAVPA